LGVRCVLSYLPMLYSSRKVPGTSTFTSWPVPNREEREPELEELADCCWSRSCCCLCCSALWASSRACSWRCCSTLRASSRCCSCLRCCSILSFSILICSCLRCSSILSFSILICSCLRCSSTLNFSILICSSLLCCSTLSCSCLCCSARAAARASWALKASETRVTILGFRTARILVTRVLEELEELEELELEENLDPEVTDWFEEKDCCCLSAFCTEVVMEGVRVEIILATRVETWAWDTCWLEVCWLETTWLEVCWLESWLATAASICGLRAASTCWASCCCCRAWEAAAAWAWAWAVACALAAEAAAAAALREASARRCASAWAAAWALAAAAAEAWPARAADTDWVMEGVSEAMTWDTTAPSLKESWEAVEVEACWATAAWLLPWKVAVVVWLVCWLRAASTAEEMEGPRADSTESTTWPCPLAGWLAVEVTGELEMEVG